MIDAEVQNLLSQKAEPTFAEENLGAILEACKVDPTKEIEKPPIIMEINNSPVATLGNFSLIIGKAKSKKTFLMIALLAACVNSQKKGMEW